MGIKRTKIRIKYQERKSNKFNKTMKYTGHFPLQPPNPPLEKNQHSSTSTKFIHTETRKRTRPRDELELSERARPDRVRKRWAGEGLGLSSWVSLLPLMGWKGGGGRSGRCGSERDGEGGRGGGVRSRERCIEGRFQKWRRRGYAFGEVLFIRFLIWCF